MNWVAPIRDDVTAEKFSQRLKQIDLKYYIMYEIGVGTGQLLQDILQLKVKDIAGKDKYTVYIGTKKIESTMYFTDELKDAIRKHTKDKAPDDYVFTAAYEDKPLSREQTYRTFRKAGHDVGLSSVGSQTMRKTFALRYYRETKDIYYLQNMFNHASPSITYRYIGEKPNIEVSLNKLTARENEQSRYMLYHNRSGKKRINALVSELNKIKASFDTPSYNDAYYGRVDCLLEEMESLMKNFKSLNKK